MTSNIPHREIVLDRDRPRLPWLCWLAMMAAVGLTGAGPPGVPGNAGIGLAGAGPVGVPATADEDESAVTQTLAFTVREIVSRVQQFGQNTRMHWEVPWLC